MIGVAGDGGAGKWTYTLHQAYIYRSGMRKVGGNTLNLILLHQTTVWMKRLTVGAHSQTCTQQGRIEGKWEKAAEARWGELPLLVRLVT